MKQEVLRLERVTYRSDGVNILDNFSFHIVRGEIMGLQPLDNDGLEELLDIIQNNPPLYFGFVYFMENRVNSWRGARRAKNRVTVIGSQSSLVKGMDVVTNIFVLRPGFRQELIRRDLLSSQLAPFLQDIGVDIDPSAPVDRLSAFERMVVEILRAVVAGHHLIILREIGSVVSESDLEQLHAIMRHYARRGFAFLYISPHYEEIRQVCTRMALMQGAAIQMQREGRDIHQPISVMYYKDYYDRVTQRIRRREWTDHREPLLEARNITGEYLDHFGFSLRKGECLIIQNLDIALHQEITAILSGDDTRRDAVLTLNGMRIRDFRSREIAYVREDPSRSMIFDDMSALENICIALDARIPSVWRRANVRRAIREEYRRLFGDDIIDKNVDALTQAERIRLVYCRILFQRPQVVFISQPYKNADVRLRFQIYELQEMLLRRGIGIVILAVNIADGLALADRLVRVGLKNGRMEAREYTKEDFASLPLNIPWVDVFSDIKKDQTDARQTIAPSPPSRG